DHRADPGELHRETTPANNGIEPLAQTVTKGIEGLGPLRRIDFGQADEPGSHRQDVVVEGAGVLKPILPPRVEPLHQRGLAAERAKAHAAADVLAEGRHAGPDAVPLPQATRGDARST